MRLDGKVALVTGAGRGIGKEIALSLIGAGAMVCLNYLTSRGGADEVVERAKGLDVDAVAIQADVSDREQVTRMVERVLDRYGRIDLLVNNAAVYSRTSFAELSDESWDSTLAVNIKGPFICAQLVAPAMLAQEEGCIVNISAIDGITPRPGYRASLADSVAKAGLIMLTRRLAIDLAPNVRVNCVAPGFIDSKADGLEEEVKLRISQRIPLGRVGTPRDVADAVLFLASDAAGYITGQVIAVDGGAVMS